MAVEILVKEEIESRLRTALPRQKILKKAKKLLSVLECSDAELSVLITDDEQIRELNAEYRHKDKATDVLSFPQQEAEGRACGAPQLLGDVVISLDTAERQAEELGHSIEDEILRLLVHGVLHLLGYEHENVGEEIAEEMFRKEQAILDLL